MQLEEQKHLYIYTFENISQIVRLYECVSEMDSSRSRKQVISINISFNEFYANL
jgi:hypothetical protein